MSRRGNCWDNAVAKSFLGSLKKERIKKRIYKNRDLATVDISDYIESFYNRTRRHKYLGGVSPEKFEIAAKQRRGGCPRTPGNSRLIQTVNLNAEGSPMITFQRVGLLLSTLVACLPAQGQTYKGGQSSCPTWSDLRKSGRSALEENWVHGYILAIYMHEKALAPHQSDMTDQNIYGWMDSYCKQHPEQLLYGAVKVLEAELKRRYSPAPSKK
jgi:hypothetical protein